MDVKAKSSVYVGTSILCLIIAGPFYLWSVFRLLNPSPSGDLSPLLISFVPPWPLLYLETIAIAGTNRPLMDHSSPHPATPTPTQRTAVPCSRRESAAQRPRVEP